MASDGDPTGGHADAQATGALGPESADMAADSTRATLPVHFIPGDDPAEPLDDRPGLCLSGGGSRAMLFHVGALWRLNELGWLPKLGRVSSVSGGSITSGVLGTRWSSLQFDGATGVASNFEVAIVEPIRSLARRNLDIVDAVLGTFLRPLGSPAARLEGDLQKHLYGEATLQSLPADGDGPRFVINATNLASGVLWRFSRPYAWDWRVGKIANPTFRVATAVAASAAFPPFFAPLQLDLPEGSFVPGTGNDLERPEFQRRVRLADGGVYDNLGLETVFKRCRTVYVSDGGGKVDDAASPPTDWGRETLRVMKVIDNQVRSLRKRLLIAAYERGDRGGTYWGIRSSIAEYGATGALPCPPEATARLAEMPTRLAAVPEGRQRALINWGYAIADAAIRSRDSSLPAPAGFPYDGGVG